MHCFDDRHRNRQIHPSAFGVVTTGARCDFRDQRMRLPFSVRWIVIDNQKPLPLDVIDKVLRLFSEIVAFDQTQVEHRRRRRRNHVACQCAHVATADAVNVQRWLIDHLHQKLAVAVGLCEPEFRADLIVVRRSFINRAPLGISEWLNTFIPAGDRHATGLILH